MALDEKTGLEYLLLRNYQENGLIGRGFLLRIPFVVLKQIEEDKWDFKIEQNEKPKLTSFIQIDIISKIMMYIEDLAILSESFMLQRNFYDLVYSSEDLGEVIGSFFEKIDYISDEEIYRIISYAAPSQINLDDESTKILNKHLKSNVKEIRRIRREIGEFGTTHHPLFKRFKHAGMPIICGHIQSSSPGFLDDFEFCNIIPVGVHPFMEVVPIPYSKQALDSYWIIIHVVCSIILIAFFHLLSSDASKQVMA